MNAVWRNAIALAVAAVATHATAQVTLYENEGFQGRSYATRQQVDNLRSQGFNDLASSAVVTGAQAEVCDDAKFRGRCVVLRRGSYPSLVAMDLNNRVSSVRVLGNTTGIEDERYAPAPVAPKATFYENEGFGGREFTATKDVRSLQRSGLNDRASSVIVVGDMREVCEDSKFRGRCVILRPGRYPSLAAMGLNDGVSSVRAVNANARIDDNRYAPVPVASAAHDYRRRDNERLYEADVTAVRAVVGTPEQRCWVEREQVAQQQSNNDLNIPGALIGAVIGGVLGHQVGGGRGKDLATAGGAVAGGALGANVGRGSSAAQPASTQDVQKCTTVAGTARPDYWDVTYNFRGQEHRVQMTTAPGPTVTVNAQGEPRV